MEWASATACSILRAVMAASSGCSTSESSTTNSSPPWRLTVSEARTQSTRRLAMDWRSLSPIGCPSESLMCLKPSRSRNSTATFFRWRGAKAIAWLTRSFSSMRLGRPVRKSCWAEWVICSAMARAALTSRKTMTAPVACPSRSWMGATESSIGISNPSRRIEDAVRRQVHRLILPDRHCHRIGDRFPGWWHPGSEDSPPWAVRLLPAAASPSFFPRRDSGR